MILELDSDAWNNVQHFPPDKGYDNADVSGRIVYPTSNDRRRYLWPMIVDDPNGEKQLFVYGPHFLPTMYFHLTQRDCLRLRWALMTRRDKIHGAAIIVSLFLLACSNVVMSVLWFTRR